MEKVYQDAAENFHKLNPKIKVIIDYLPPNITMVSGLDQRKMLERSEPPDIVQLPADELIVAEKKGLLRNLWELQKSTGSKELDINKPILDAASINGKLLLLPYAAYPSLVLYNKAMFDLAHIPYPNGDWTWEHFRDISRRIKPALGSVLLYNSSTLEILMASTGKSIISPKEGMAVGYLDSSEAIRSVQWLNAYYRDDAGKTASLNFPEHFQKLDTNQTGMIVGNISIKMSSFQGENKGNLGYAPLPHFEGGKRGNPIGISGYGISQKSKHAQAAWEFLQYFTQTPNDDSINYASQYLTTSKAMAEATGSVKDPIKTMAADEMNYAVKVSSAYNPYYNQAWNRELTADFNSLLTTNDKDIPDKLHLLALKLDQEMNCLKLVDEQQATSSPK